MVANSALIIRHAHILLPDGTWMTGDVQLFGGTIAQVAETLPPTATADDTIELDASGLTLLPGVIAPQVHFREPGLEYKEDLFTASCACAKGSVTSFLEMSIAPP
ncbi:hypothetical protein [Stenomitos frigidus]|uniref:hypothetical protein n=1 Tax=Stenomitos frigidus TaxID=1886765 RepID=UPI0015E6E5C6|nr:hypothetical protein [Stenomitos frigidus]